MKILISDKIHEKGINVFEENGFEVVRNFKITPEELKNEIENFAGIVVRSRTKLRAETLEMAKNLKVIGRAGVGLDNIDLEKAANLGIQVLNTPEAPSVSVAELTIGLILSLARHITKADKTMHCGEWCKGDYLGFTLKEKKVGLIGFGNIGQAVAKRCAALEMEIGIYDVDNEAKKKAEDLGYKIYPSVDELVSDAQIISLHIPSTVHTQDTINEKRLGLMKKDAMVINTARGTLIDEKALLKALNTNKIAGAALDVYREEPLTDEALCGCDRNLILTPHIGSQTVETQVDAAVMVAEKMVKFLKEKS